MQLHLSTILILIMLAFLTCQYRSGGNGLIDNQAKVTSMGQEDSDSSAMDTLVTNLQSELADFTEVTRTAVDRECGSCHHSNQSTNEAALSIFDLENKCWYCTLGIEHVAGLKTRTMESDDFSEEEKQALQLVIAEIEVNVDQ